MDRGWRYRIASGLGTIVIGIAVVAVTNLPPVHEVFSQIPYFGRPAPEVLPPGELRLATLTMLVVIVASMWPLFKPRPRRILDTIVLTHKRVLLAMIFLAGIGYFNYSYRLPRTTLMLTTLALLAVLPVFMVAIRERPRSGSTAILVGDDPDAMESLLLASQDDVAGYVSPPSAHPDEPERKVTVSVTDGGQILSDLECLGGLARLDDVIVKRDVGTVLLGFSDTDRDEFFGTLEVCHDFGVEAKVHRDHADHVLTDDFSGDELLDVDLEPWDWQDHVVKRLFDVAFAGLALLVLVPVIAVISLAIKLDDGGPLFYRQERTATFGDTFTIAKFRSMVTDAESKTGAKLSEEDAGGVDPRVTRVGRVLRKTHLDEIPQLWSILVGDMSVVGPRPERPELDSDIEQGVGNWRRRWFVKPGLTGLAQINNATGHTPKQKLRYDIEYIRRQSFWFDMKIVARQLWMVGKDALGFVVGESVEEDDDPGSKEASELVDKEQSDESRSVAVRANGGNQKDRE